MMSEDVADIDGKDPYSRKQLLRDAVVFQGKLLIDGLRDLILCPVAIVAACADLIRHEGKPTHHFYEVVYFGRRTEHWIDLFSAAERAPERSRPDMDLPSVDEIVDHVEGRLNRGKHAGEPS